MLPQETFTRHWDQNKYNNFRDKFNIYNDQVNDAFDETDPGEVFRNGRSYSGRASVSPNPRTTEHHPVLQWLPRP